MPTMTTIICSVFIGLILALAIPLLNYVRKCLNARRLLSHIPGITAWHFIFAGIESSSEAPVHMFKDWKVLKKARKYLAEREGMKEEDLKFWRLTLGPHNFIVTNDPEIYKQVFATKSKHFGKPFYLVYDGVTPGTRDVFTSDGELWKKHRTLLNGAFTEKSMENIFNTWINKTSNKVITKYSNLISPGESTILNASREMGNFSLDTIAESGFGIEIDSIHDPDPQIPRWIKSLFIQAGLTMFLPRFMLRLPIQFFKNLSTHAALFRRFLEDVISQRRVDIISGKDVDNNVLTRMITANDDEYKQFTNEELLADCTAIAAGGFDTTAITLSWSMLYLAKYPEIQSKLREEALVHMPDPSKLLTYEEFKQGVPYTKAFFKEILRFRSPAPGIDRLVKKTTTFGDVTLPKGTIISMLLQDTMTDVKYWGEDAMSFRPDRFIENPNLEKEVFYTPFGYGPRVCIGRHLAEMESATMVMKMVRSFQIDFAKDHNDYDQVQEVTQFVRQPKEEIFVKLTKLVQ